MQIARARQRLISSYRKQFRKHRKRVVPLLLVLTTASVIIIYMNSQPTKIDPSAYVPLLSTVAKGESRGNYNAYFGNASNTDVRLTDMSIDEVLRWQKDYVENGSPSSAVGRYQIIRPTLEKLVRELKLDGTQKFDEAMQDRMAIALMERRGSIDYVDGKISRDEFAANLSQEWAALPKITGENPEQSFYAGDGLNKANIAIPDIYQAVGQLKSTHNRK